MVRPLFCVVLFFMGASGVWGQESSVIRIDGEPSMVPFTQRLTEWYHQGNQSASFKVSGAGPVRAIQSLVDGKVEVVQSARQAVGGEVTALRERRGKQFVEVPVAMEVVGILVHPSNPVQELSIFDLRQILSGAVKNWKQVGGKDAPIKIYGRDTSSDIGDFIEAEYMGDAGISSTATTFAKNSALYAAVASDPDAIGYASVNLSLNPTCALSALKLVPPHRPSLRQPRALPHTNIGLCALCITFSLESHQGTCGDSPNGSCPNKVNWLSKQPSCHLWVPVIATAAKPSWPATDQESNNSNSKFAHVTCRYVLILGGSLML